MSTLDLARRGRLADVRRGETLSFDLPVKGAVYAVSGQLWVTQEGLYEDVILAPGERFAVERKGLIVVNALNDSAIAYLAPPSAYLVHGFPVEFQDAVIAHAKALRRHELARLAALARAYTARIAARAWLWVRSAFPGARVYRPHRP